MNNIKKLLFILAPKLQKKARLLIVMILIMALLDMIGVASILPFISVLTNPSLVDTNKVLITMFQVSQKLGVDDKQQFLFALGILFFVTIVFSISFKAITNYFQIRFGAMCEHLIAKRLVEGYLHQPYSWFLNRNSSELAKNILSQVGLVVGGFIQPLMELIAKGMVVIALVTLLIIANPKVALIITFFVGTSYGLLYYFVGKYLNKLGKKNLLNNKLRFSIINEAFSGAKEVKVSSLEDKYVKRFSETAENLVKSGALALVIKQLPRFILEIILFAGILLLILYMMSQKSDFIGVLPIITLFLFAGYRLMPAAQQAYASFSQLKFIGPSIDNLYIDLKNLRKDNLNFNQDIIPPNKMITLKNLYFNYPNTSRSALKNINLTIPLNTKVGLVGVTGSGKTTIVDVILGLLESSKGTLDVDGQIITKHNAKAWQRYIGYVPQNIYLSDASISANIAFGKEPKEINQENVEKASKIASLHEFVINELPEQYNTIIGERGIRLSGGQRQRIGIARALYHKPKILILDEATSALDNQTEEAVMDAINNLNKEITIILIAHRLNTVKNCDVVFQFKNGELVSKGKFDEIFDKN